MMDQSTQQSLKNSFGVPCKLKLALFCVVNPVQLDVADPSSVAAAAASLAAEQLPRIDVLINNVGIIKHPSGSLSADLSDTLATNAVGPAVVTAALLPLLKASSNPRLIYVLSGLGSIAHLTDPSLPFSIPFGLEYRMSKVALNMLAVYHHCEFATWGCKVWAFCPGYVLTNLSGADDRENRVLRGAVGVEVPAQALADVLEGRRDADTEKFIHEYGTYMIGDFFFVAAWGSGGQVS
ncbi:hypothetical protein HK405_005535 [Cladochytrium tenue]|nr:hypothetical protein HK405_005535 [Cladochytrium tenue]